MAWRSLPCVVAAAAVLGIAPAAVAGTAYVGASVNLIQPAIITADQASELLQSTTPGVFTISFPDLAGAATGSGATAGSGLILTGFGARSGSSSFVFSVGSENAAALDSLMAELGLPAEGGLAGGFPTNTLTASGYIDGKGFQMAVVQIVRTPDGGGYISAIIPFN